MTNDDGRILTIPRHNPVNAVTIGGGIVRDVGLTIEQFKALLSANQVTAIGLRGGFSTFQFNDPYQQKSKS